jgi:hypothetical protein
LLLALKQTKEGKASLVKSYVTTTFLRRFCRNTGSEKPDVDIGDVFVDLDDCVNLLSVYSVSNGNKYKNEA